VVGVRGVFDDGGLIQSVGITCALCHLTVVPEPTLATRLRFLNRGQGWVVKRLDGLLGETLPASVSEFLAEMKTRHIANIAACDRLAESLT
jgi:hypothetical protein